MTAAPEPPVLRTLYRLLIATTAILLLVDLWLIAGAPVEARMGVVQKIFYFHVPSAYAMYLCYALCGIGSVAYIVLRDARWDALAVSAGEAGLVFALFVMISGPLWGRKAWGTFWTWDPRLTTTLLVAMIYMSYVVLRSFGESGEAERRFAAGLGIVGTFMIPVIHYSVEAWQGVHPRVVMNNGGGGLAPEMLPPFLLGFALFTSLAVLLVWSRYRVERTRETLTTLEIEAAELGLLEDA